MSCNKRKLSKLREMIISNDPKRQETREYYCDKCRAWHTSSMTYAQFQEHIKT